MAPSPSDLALTTHLLSTNQEQFRRATQTPFLQHAASGQLPRSVISHWLANDRLYMQGYISLTGSLLRILQLPQKPTPSKSAGSSEVQLLDWLVDALVNIRREERFFMDVAERYGMDVDLTDQGGAVVAESKKIEGLRLFEKVFADLTSGSEPPHLLPWLEGAVVFWATEKVYLEAWCWAKRQAESTATQEPSNDADGGAMREEFIPNWTNDEFVRFVDTLERIVNDGVREAVGSDAGKWEEVLRRAEGWWKRVLDAEERFWPEV